VRCEPAISARRRNHLTSGCRRTTRKLNMAHRQEYAGNIFHPTTFPGSNSISNCQTALSTPTLQIFRRRVATFLIFIQRHQIYLCRSRMCAVLTAGAATASSTLIRREHPADVLHMRAGILDRDHSVMKSRQPVPPNRLIQLQSIRLDALAEI